MEELTTLSVGAIVPLILALTQVIKMIAGDRLSKWAPVISIGLGILLSFLFLNEENSLSESVIAGIIYGLSASGLYSGTKATAHAVKGTEDK